MYLYRKEIKKKLMATNSGGEYTLFISLTNKYVLVNVGVWNGIA